MARQVPATASARASDARGLRRLVSAIGPGLITGAADDDPSGIATYVQTGAQFGYGQLWTALFVLPLLTAVQEAAARVGAVTGKGLAAVMRDRYGVRLVYVMIALLLLANTINIGADIGAMGAAAQLLVPLPLLLLTVVFAVIMVTFEVFLPYRTYARILKWLTLSLLAYPITVFRARALGDAAAGHLRPAAGVHARLPLHRHGRPGDHHRALHVLLGVVAGGRGGAQRRPAGAGGC
jgi:Mn2+/Fe2+ NRAMP family transporter